MEKRIDLIIRRALKEDHSDRDITTNILVSPSQTSRAYIIVKENAVVCGLDVVRAIFQKLDRNMNIKEHAREGDKVKKGTKIVSLKGKTRALLTGERVALNFLSYLSGIATITNRFVEKARPYEVKIMDTRKTLPGLRGLVKMAVRAGGGVNHRFNLKEMVMIKDNHQIAYQKDKTIQDAIRHVRARTKKMIMVEVDTIIQFRQALKGRPDVILLDNMSPKQIGKIVSLNRKSPAPCLLEASGGINLRNIRAIAKTGVDRISIGTLTHSPRAVDFSIEFIA